MPRRLYLPLFRITSVLIAVVVAIFVTAPEALTEIVVVVVLAYVIAIIAVVGVLIGKRVFVVDPSGPAGLPIRYLCLLIAVIEGLPEQISAVFVGFVVAAAAIVTIIRGRVEVRIATEVMIAVILDAQLLLTQAR